MKGQKIISDTLKKAIHSYKILLDLGFTREHSLNLIQTHYNLLSHEKQLLYRTIHPSAHDYQVFKKTFFSATGEADCIAIDFYNTAITMAEALEGHAIYRGSDGFLRDLAKAYGRSRKNNEILQKSALLMLETAHSLGFRKAYLIAEKQVSYSGELMSKLSKEVLPSLAVKTVLTPMVDNMVMDVALKKKCIVASSDTLILERAERVIDLPLMTLLKKNLSGSIMEVWRLSYP
jgi:hypothetical protein